MIKSGSKPSEHLTLILGGQGPYYATWLQQAIPGMKAAIHMAACHGVTDGHVGTVLDVEVH